MKKHPLVIAKRMHVAHATNTSLFTSFLSGRVQLRWEYELRGVDWKLEWTLDWITGLDYWFYIS